MKVTIPPERLLYTTEEAAASLGIGTTKMKSMLRDGEIRSVKIGRLRRITASSLKEYVVLLEMKQNEGAE